MHHIRTCLVVAGLCLVLLTACPTQRPDAHAPPAKDKAAPTVRVVAERAGLSFRFRDPSTGAFATALRRDDVPEAARALVIVHDEDLPTDVVGAGEAILADLRQADAEGAFPSRIVSLVQASARARPAGPEAPSRRPVAAPGVRAQDVLLFVTSWCPHCRRAEAWLTKRGVPFEKLDVETRAGARALLSRVLAENQIPADMGSSVPIVVVRGKALIGFDEAAVARLLEATEGR